MKTNTDETLLHYQCIARRMRSLPDKCKNKKHFGWQFEAIFCISGVWHVG